MWAHKNWLCLLLGLTAVAFANAQASIHARLIGGNATTVNTAPHMVQLLKDNGPLCGASILSSKWVLTAAHCIAYSTTPSRYKIRAGTSYLSGNQGITRNVLKITIHPDYYVNSLNNDVAMLLVDAIPLNGQTMKAIALCSKAMPSGVDVKVSGWGYTVENGPRSNQLRSITAKTIPHKTCFEIYIQKGYEVTDMQMCTATQGKAICTGDSGSGLVYKNELCGSVSWSLGCGKTGNPSVYADIFKIKPFITKVMNTK